MRACLRLGARGRRDEDELRLYIHFTRPVQSLIHNGESRASIPHSLRPPRVAQQCQRAHRWCLPSRRSCKTSGLYCAARTGLIVLQFSLGIFFFIDAATYSKSARNGSDIHIRFVDWIPGICSTLGMLVINSIDKARLSGDTYSYSGNGVAWKARLVLFLGFALMAGGLAGAVVCADDETPKTRCRQRRLTRGTDGNGAEICGTWL